MRQWKVGEAAWGSELRRHRRVCPYVEVDFTRVAGVWEDGGVRDGQAGGGRVRSWLLVVQNSGQQGWPSFLLLLIPVFVLFTLCIRRRWLWGSAANAVSVQMRKRRVWEGEYVGWSGPGSLFSFFTLALLLAPEAGLLLGIFTKASSLQILQVVRFLSPADFTVPVLVQQRGGADEDEEANSHYHGASQFHPVHGGGAAPPHGLRFCRDVARHCNTHPHQHHHYTQQEPPTWGRSQGQFGLEGFAFPQVSVALRGAGRWGVGRVGRGRAADWSVSCHRLDSDWEERREASENKGMKHESAGCSIRRALEVLGRRQFSLHRTQQEIAALIRHVAQLMRCRASRNSAGVSEELMNHHHQWLTPFKTLWFHFTISLRLKNKLESHPCANCSNWTHNLFLPPTLPEASGPNRGIRTQMIKFAFTHPC